MLKCLTGDRKVLSKIGLSSKKFCTLELALLSGIFGFITGVTERKKNWKKIHKLKFKQTLEGSIKSTWIEINIQ